VTSDTPLSRLRAGLDRDEAIARKAFLPTMPGSDRWWFDAMKVWTETEPPTPAVGHTWPNEGEHIARQCPQATLDRVEAIRKVIADIRDPKIFEDHYSGAIDYDSFRCGVDAAAEFLAEALASIYPELS
jgi:hypothetical protein